MTAQKNTRARGKDLRNSPSRIDRARLLESTHEVGGIIDADAVAQLTDLIELMESTEWRRVPGVSTSTAATFTRRLIEARAEVRAGQ